MRPPARQSVALITKELEIHITTLYAWKKAWRLKGEVVPASEKDPEGWSASDKFTAVLESAGLNTIEYGAFFVKGVSSRCCKFVGGMLPRITIPSFDLAK